MKITWKNIDNIKITKFCNFRYKNRSYVLIERCKECESPFLIQKYYVNKGKGDFCSHKCRCIGDSNPFYGKTLSTLSIKKMRNTIHKKYGDYNKNNIPVFDTYQPQLEPYGVECRRNKEDKNILEVKCMYCDKWYKPIISSISSKIRSIKGTIMGENNLYCNDGCKQSCPTYGQKLYPKGFKQNTSREVQPQLRKLVLERDNYECQKCGSIKSLHCHYITGVEINPIESADIDDCITFCK